MNFHNISAVFSKQWKDNFKNKAVFIQFIMFPILVIIMENLVKIPGTEGQHMFVVMFSAMYTGMAPLISVTAVISEEKETGTLFALRMADVKPSEYMLGIGCNTYFCCAIGILVFAFVGEYSGIDFLLFFIYMSVSVIIGVLVGAIIGILGKNQMSATAIAVPAMLICAFIPMFAQYNKTIRMIAKYTYAQQINELLSDLNGITLERGIILGVNIVIILGLFLFAYKKVK